MKEPQKTSDLLQLQQATDTELRKRCAAIFERNKAMAFAGRDDQFFRELWTPESAATPYQLDRYEVKGDRIVLFGVWCSDCFINTISMAFPSALIDDDAAIAAFLRDECERNKAVWAQRRAAVKAQEFLVQ
jgi:hypothetical protein